MFGFNSFASHSFSDVKEGTLYTKVLNAVTGTSALFVRQVGRILSYLQAINVSMIRALVRVQLLNASITSVVSFSKQIKKTLTYVVTVLSSFVRLLYKTISTNTIVSLFIQRTRLVVLTVISLIPVGGLNSFALNSAAINSTVIFRRIGVLAINYMSKKVIKTLPSALVTVNSFFITQRSRFMVATINTSATFVRRINKIMQVLTNVIITFIPSILSFKIFNNERLYYVAQKITTTTTTKIRTVFYTLTHLGK
jgi:hypothetical protein